MSHDKNVMETARYIYYIYLESENGILGIVPMEFFLIVTELSE